uniref:Myosin motor domain-containing protein n=1 Tax=Ciona savignyi TaxID=51511 RepID=H2Z331_CIOSA
MEINDKISCLNALESTRNSLFALLNEECRLNRTTDALQLKSRLTDSFHKSPYITQPRISTETPSFTVNHYAGKVVYAVKLLTVKNKDELPLEIRELLVDSTNPFICNLFLDKSPDPATPSTKGKSLETVLSQFKKSLDELLTTMSTTNCNYIRCIKPNMESLPSKFDSRHVVEQLKSSGVVKTIQICGSLHPHQLSYPHFISQHVFVLRLGKNKPSNVKDYAQLDLKKSQKVCRQILTEVLNGQKQVESEKLWQFGKTSIFLSGDLYEVLQTMRSEAVSISATKIQTAWRYFTQRRFCRLLMKRVIQRRQAAATTLQRHWRLRWSVRKCRKERKQEITARNKAATLLQHFWRFYKANQLRGHAAGVIQSAYRKWKERMSYKQTEASDEEVVAIEPVVPKSIPLQFASVYRNDTLLQPNIDLDTNLASLDENLSGVTFERLTVESSLIYVCNLFQSLPVEALNRKHKYGNFSFFYLTSFHIHVSPIDLLKLCFLVSKENNSSIFSFRSNKKRVYKFNATNVKPSLPSILPYSDVVPFKMFT